MAGEVAVGDEADFAHGGRWFEEAQAVVFFFAEVVDGEFGQDGNALAGVHHFFEGFDAAGFVL